MRTAASLLALITLMAVPATVVAWLLLHALVARWRRIGPARTCAVIGAAVIAAMAGTYVLRAPLLHVRAAVRMPLAAASLVLLAASAAINALVFREAPKSMVFGFDEIARDDPGRLITSGIYGRLRHPRFVAMALAVAAMALLTNVLAVYVIAVVYVPAIYLITVLEDRELAARFGRRFDAYARQVPRFLPRSLAGFLPRPAKRRRRRKSGTGDDEA